MLSSPELQSSVPQVLILDDIEHWRKLLVRFLNHNGIATLSTGSEAEAFKLLQRSDVKLLIQDFTREKGDRGGFHLLRWMWSCPATANIPVIMISGTHPESIKKAFAEYRVSMDESLLGFWAKPMYTAEIAEMVELIRTQLHLE